MVDITVFELHLDGAEFTANAPGVSEGDVETSEESDAGAPLGLFAVVALVVLVVAAVAIKKVGGGDDEPDAV